MCRFDMMHLYCSIAPGVLHFSALVVNSSATAGNKYSVTRIMGVDNLKVIAAYYVYSGLLLAVGDLEAKDNATSVTISWTPPFSLNVTGVDPDIWYSVFIYNVTDENNPTAILCTNCTNITETHYTFTPDYLSPCHVYNFSVVSLNGAGQGESSGNVTGTECSILKFSTIFIKFFCRYE